METLWPRRLEFRLLQPHSIIANKYSTKNIIWHVSNATIEVDRLLYAYCEFNLIQYGTSFAVECKAVSMGQGQEVHARRLMNQFMQSVSVFVCIKIPKRLFKR